MVWYGTIENELLIECNAIGLPSIEFPPLSHFSARGVAFLEMTPPLKMAAIIFLAVKQQSS